MKVYIMTVSKPFGEEIFKGVASTRKGAEKELRRIYPHMKPSGADSYVADNTNTLLLFIREEEVI